MSNAPPHSFIELCLGGDVSTGDIDSFVDRWHDGRAMISLREYLGMSEIEYSLWINDPDVISDILQARRDGQPFAEAINDHYGNQSKSETLSDHSARLKILREWLDMQGYAAARSG